MARLPSKALIAMAGTAAMKARDYARQNPEKVEQALGKVQGTVSRRTGGKYDTHLGRGSSAVLKGLGLPDTAAGPAAQRDGTVGEAATPPSATPPPPPPSATPPPPPPSATPPPPPPSWTTATGAAAPADTRTDEGPSPRAGT